MPSRGQFARHYNMAVKSVNVPPKGTHLKRNRITNLRDEWPTMVCPLCGAKEKLTQDGYPFTLWWWFYCGKCWYSEKVGLITEMTPSIKPVEPPPKNHILDNKGKSLYNVLIDI